MCGTHSKCGSNTNQRECRAKPHTQGPAVTLRGWTPPVSGVVHCWRFANEGVENRGIAHSCRDLIDTGINPRHILILLSNPKRLLRRLKTALETIALPFEAPDQEGFMQSDGGRFALAVLRIVCGPNDSSLIDWSWA